MGIVDYAHTPDGLKNVLAALQQLRGDAKNKILTVCGCGGERDKSKRPKMAFIGITDLYTDLGDIF